MPTETLPPMDPRERADLEREAGHPFNSDREAYEYLRRKIQCKDIQSMLEEG